MPTSSLEIGARLVGTRKALGLTQAEMDRRMGSGLTKTYGLVGIDLPVSSWLASAAFLQSAARRSGPGTPNTLYWTRKPRG